MKSFKPRGLNTKERVTESEERLRELNEKMRSWNEFVREMAVLPELVPALSTGRVELLALMKARPLDEKECETLFEMLRVLIETNQALRMHCELVGQLADQQYELAGGMLTKLGELVEFAQFRNPVSDESSDTE